MMRSRRRFTWAALVTPLLVIGLLMAGWAVDTSLSSGEVIRNTELAGQRIGGLDESELTTAVTDLAERYGEMTVSIENGDESMETTAGRIGLSIDESATTKAALEVGNQRALPVRPFTWLGSLVSPHEVTPVFTIDPALTAAELTELEGDERVPATEPDVVFYLGTIVAVPGDPGSGIDADRLIADLLGAAESAGVAPITVTAKRGPIPPLIADERADELATEALDLTADPITVSVGEDEVAISPETQRSWIRSRIDGDELTTNFDVEAIQESVQSELSITSESPIDASFEVQGGVPVVIPGRIGKGCCAPDSGDKVLEALKKGEDRVELELIEREPDLTDEEANALGITTEVGQPDQFGPTTRHRGGESRVTNIHRIADIVRGAVIKPGETFSVNDYVGQRTSDKGFVPAGVIYNGVFEDDVGGGVSQFATTLFNAALFAGLDFGTYQSHSIYISRYPYGHEATISYPNPDLQIVNNTPYGVLIWPEYTNTSLTVRLYSTPHAQVQLGAPQESPSGNCKRVTTPRTRTYPDGTTENDSVGATYRPGEGIDC